MAKGCGARAQGWAWAGLGQGLGRAWGWACARVEALQTSPNPNPDPDPDPNPNPSPNQVRWAEEFGLKLVLDLHGAPGSQNGEQTAGWEDPLWTAERFDEDAAVQVVLRTRV